MVKCVFPEKKRKSSGSPLIPIAVLTALIGGVGAALLTNPKNSKIKKSLQEIGDEVVDVFDVILAKAEAKAHIKPDSELGEISKTLVTFFDEIKNLNDSAEEKESVLVKETPVQKVTEIVKHDVEFVEEKVSEVSNDIADRIAWLQKKGRLLAKKSVRS
jgi:hypothetical protein